MNETNKKIFLIGLIIILAGCATFVWQKGLFRSNTILDNKDIQKQDGETSILGNPLLDEAVTNFLLSEQQFSWKTGEGSTNFCVFQNLNPESELFPIYIWIRCGEFKIVSGELKELSGTSLPIKIDYPNELSYYDQAKFSFEAPRDGSLYDGDIKRIFPENIWHRLNFDSVPLNQQILKVAQKSLITN